MIKIILAFIISFSCFGTELYLKTKKYQTVQTGDSFIAKINSDDDNLKFEDRMYNEQVSDNLFLVSINNKKKKSYGTFIVSTINKNFEKNYFKINDFKYLYTLTNITIIDNKIKSDELIILKQLYKWKDDFWLKMFIGICTLILLIIIFVVIKKKIINNKIKKKYNEEKLNWFSFINQTERREDHELLFKNKDKINSYLENKCNDYFLDVDKIQYKEIWSETDWETINSSFEELKEMVKNGI